MNIKYDRGDGSPVITIMDDPGCVMQTVQQGPKGNVLVKCTRREYVPKQDIPQMWNGFQVLAGAIDWNIGAGIAMHSPKFTSGQIAVYEMTTGPEPAAACSLMIAEYGGAVPERLVVISEKPCDFTINNTALPAAVGTKPTVYFSVGTTSPYGDPVLKPSTKYYVNIRNASLSDPNGDTCLPGQDCKFVMSLRHQ